MYNLRKKFYETWSQNNVFTKTLLTISSFLILLSIIMIILNIINQNNNNKTTNEINSMNKSLEILADFDAKYPGKWVHYIQDKFSTADIQNSLKLINFNNYLIKQEGDLIEIEGQVENIVQLTNAIQLLYNNHGLVINTLKLNVIDGLNIYTLKLIY
tara:strand:- start:1057 stop:1527 length:471 start_codon:yes stop_codon:yes gene_type:complete